MARRSFLQRLDLGWRYLTQPQSFARRMDGARIMTDRNARFTTYAGETAAASYRLRDRSRYYTENNAYFAAATRALATNLVGAGIAPASLHPDPATQALLAQRWATFSDQVDFEGVTNIGGMQFALVADMVRDGDALAIMRNTADGLRMQRLAAEMLDESQTRDLGNGAYIQSGVEFDSSGHKVALWIFPHAPGNTSAQSIESIRVPFDDVIHMFEPRGPGQCRGLPWGSSALKRIGEIDQLEDALLTGNKTAAMFCGVVTDEFSSTPLPFDGEQSGSTLISGLEPGTLLNLGAGKKVSFSTPNQSQQGVEFLASQLRAVASAFGVPPALLDSDYSKANYSSLRAALVTYAARLDSIVHTIIRPQMLDRIWRRWITTEILRGAIEARDFESDPEKWFGVEWYGPAPPVADEAKAAQADKIQIDMGVKSRGQAIRERGYSPEALDAERRADAEREKSLGLAAPQSKPKESANA